MTLQFVAVTCLSSRCEVQLATSHQAYDAAGCSYIASVPLDGFSPGESGSMVGFPLGKTHIGGFSPGEIVLMWVFPWENFIMVGFSLGTFHNTVGLLCNYGSSLVPRQGEERRSGHETTTVLGWHSSL